MVNCFDSIQSSDKENTQDALEKRIALLCEMNKNVCFFENCLVSMQGFVQALMLNKEDESALPLERFKSDFDSFLMKFKQLKQEFSDIEVRHVSEQAELLQIAAHFIMGVSQWIVMIPQFLKSHPNLSDSAQVFLNENKLLYDQIFNKKPDQK